MNMNTPQTQVVPVLPERLANDPAAKALALELLQFERGRARVRMDSGLGRIAAPLCAPSQSNSRTAGRVPPSVP
jgi:hypothetical protein